jgi:hypothetical protein
MAEERIRGSCLCGAVQFELDGPVVWAHVCHCSRCRKARGSAFAANAFVPLEALHFTRGESEVGVYRPPEADRFVHAFCTRCGASVPFRNPARGLAGVPMGGLDVDPGQAPKAHIFVGSKAPWYTIHDDLPQYVEGLEGARVDDPAEDGSEQG